MKATRPSIAKLTKSISQLSDDSIIGCPIVITYKLILQAKSDAAKERLVETAILMTEEKAKRGLERGFEQ